MCQRCVRDNYFSVYFPAQPFFVAFLLVVIQTFSFSTFSIFYKTHTPALQLATESYWKDW